MSPVGDTKAATISGQDTGEVTEDAAVFGRLGDYGWTVFTSPAGVRHFAAQRTRDALVRDLDRRGMLDDTLVIWGGEFGRTAYSQGKLTRENYGRDHHPRCFAMWLAGGGIKGGVTYGDTDDFSYNIVENPVLQRELLVNLRMARGFVLLFLYQAVLAKGLRTADIYSAGTTKVGTKEMGDAVVAHLKAQG